MGRQEAVQERVFGPVPSRRLGRSLGINNVPAKTCSYACVYCQLGRSIVSQADREGFLTPEQIAQEVEAKLEQVRAAGEAVDYLTFVPDGEPTLDVNLGRAIELLRSLGIPIAVISNSSLLWRDDVRADLMGADWVSLKVDAVDERVWRRIDRPHPALRLRDIIEGMESFASAYGGSLATETMLVGGLNDDEQQLAQVASLVAKLAPAVAYLAIPTRPPAEQWVRPPSEHSLNHAYQVFAGRVATVEYLIGYEGDAFASTGNAEEDLLSITAVHPMREDAVRAFMARASAEWSIVERLVAGGTLIRAEYGGHTFYVRRFVGARWGADAVRP